MLVDSFFLFFQLVTQDKYAKIIVCDDEKEQKNKMGTKKKEDECKFVSLVFRK